MTGTLRGVSNKHCLLSFFHLYLAKLLSSALCDQMMQALVLQGTLVPTAGVFMEK